MKKYYWNRILLVYGTAYLFTAMIIFIFQDEPKQSFLQILKEGVFTSLLFIFIGFVVYYLDKLKNWILSFFK